MPSLPNPTVYTAGSARNWFSGWVSTGQWVQLRNHASGEAASGLPLPRRILSSPFFYFLANQPLNQILRILFRVDPLSGIFRIAFWVDGNRTVWLFCLLRMVLLVFASLCGFHTAAWSMIRLCLMDGLGQLGA